MKRIILSLLLILFLGGCAQANPVPAFWLFATNVEGAEDWFQGDSVTENSNSHSMIRRYSLFGSSLVEDDFSSGVRTTYSLSGSTVHGGGTTYSLAGSYVTECTPSGETKSYSLFGSSIMEYSSSGTTKRYSLMGSSIHSSDVYYSF